MLHRALTDENWSVFLILCKILQGRWHCWCQKKIQFYSPTLHTVFQGLVLDQAFPGFKTWGGSKNPFSPWLFRTCRFKYLFDPGWSLCCRSFAMIVPHKMRFIRSWNRVLIRNLSRCVSFKKAARKIPQQIPVRVRDFSGRHMTAFLLMSAHCRLSTTDQDAFLCLSKLASFGKFHLFWIQSSTAWWRDDHGHLCNDFRFLSAAKWRVHSSNSVGIDDTNQAQSPETETRKLFILLATFCWKYLREWNSFMRKILQQRTGMWGKCESLACDGDSDPKPGPSIRCSLTNFLFVVNFSEAKCSLMTGLSCEQNKFRDFVISFAIVEHCVWSKYHADETSWRISIDFPLRNFIHCLLFLWLKCFASLLFNSAFSYTQHCAVLLFVLNSASKSSSSMKYHAVKFITCVFLCLKHTILWTLFLFHLLYMCTNTVKEPNTHADIKLHNFGHVRQCEVAIRLGVMGWSPDTSFLLWLNSYLWFSWSLAFRITI